MLFASILDADDSPCQGEHRTSSRSGFDKVFKEKSRFPWSLSREQRESSLLEQVSSTGPSGAVLKCFLSCPKKFDGLNALPVLLRVLEVVDSMKGLNESFLLAGVAALNA